jgi:peroxiredoxin
MQRRPLLIASAAGLALATPLTTWAAATVGQPAPGFTLTDTTGKPVRLADFKGRAVVLEWNNPGCPFVRKHYQGNMQALQKEAAAQGVVWLAINSTESASGDYLSPAQLARWMQDKQAAPTATLMDEDGTAGKAYGARVTPHMYIVNAQGVLVYAGGIDSIPSARVDDIPKATNYVRQALAEIKAGKPVSVATSQAYGCSVKYKS